MGENGLSIADAMALAKDGNNGLGTGAGGTWIWVFFLFFLLAWGGGDLSFQLYNNGVAIPGAIATNNIATASNKANYAFTAAIRVLASCPVINNTAQLTIQNISANAATVTNAAVTIKAA